MRSRKRSSNVSNVKSGHKVSKHSDVVFPIAGHFTPDLPLNLLIGF